MVEQGSFCIQYFFRQVYFCITQLAEVNEVELRVDLWDRVRKMFAFEGWPCSFGKMLSSVSSKCPDGRKRDTQSFRLIRYLDLHSLC